MSESRLSRFTTDYGMFFVLLVLCGYYSVVTWAEQHPAGEEAAEALLEDILAMSAREGDVLIVVRDQPTDRRMAERLAADLEAEGRGVLPSVIGQPIDARRAIENHLAEGRSIAVIAGNSVTASWTVFEALRTKHATFRDVPVLQPASYGWPNFLKADNVLNVANQISVIAIIAIGMSFVIITGGIDLSVGSLIAFSAVLAALFIREFGGGESAGTLALVLSCAAAIATCTVVGWFTGVLVAFFGIRAFIVTLSMMLVASGLAYQIAEGQSIYQIPESFTWLGRGADLFGAPNAVVLMLVLYGAAHFLMTRTVLGRYIYAVGGNEEAARLSGVPVRRVLVFVYAVSAALAGLGGIITASQLQSGSPTYGQMYELYVIAAVVVGGTSLSGGEGKVLGTLIGALIIAVIQNGMNLTGVDSYTQKVVLGLVLLLAVLLDRGKKLLARR